jgi:hypothetical protein
VPEQAQAERTNSAILSARRALRVGSLIAMDLGSGMQESWNSLRSEDSGASAGSRVWTLCGSLDCCERLGKTHLCSQLPPSSSFTGRSQADRQY